MKITQGTNTEANKTRLFAEFQPLLERELGPLAATDWGYGGQSQASRLAGRL